MYWYSLLLFTIQLTFVGPVRALWSIWFCSFFNFGFSPYQLSVSNSSGVKCYVNRYTSVLMFRRTVIMMLLIFWEESGYQWRPRGAFHLLKISGISGSTVNGARFVGSSHWKIPRKSGKSKKVSPFSRLEVPNGISCSIYTLLVVCISSRSAARKSVTAS